MTTLNRIRQFLGFVSAVALSIGFTGRVLGQPEFTAWGNLTGIRVEGHLIGFETSLCLIGSDLMQVTQTAKEQQRPNYRLEGNRQTVTTRLGDVSFVEVVESSGDGKALLNVKAKAEADTNISGAFLCLEFPSGDFSDPEIELIDSTASTIEPIPSFPGPQGRWRRFSRNVHASVKGARIKSQDNRIEVTINESTEIIVQRGNRFFGNSGPRIYFGVMAGAAKQGRTAEKTFTVKAAGKIDKEPIQMTVDATRPGRVFDGIGGNFRLQNPDTDPRVIDYCLENLNVTWARVEMPWSNWHPVESVNPIEAARAGKIHPNVADAMLMAQRLARKNIPVILSAWRAPSWAVTGEMNFRQQGGLRGNPLNSAKMKSIVKSIGSYIQYLKEGYGVEAAMFSFNESDLGINVRQTGEEHADLIKSAGVQLAAMGLETKMLLGDNSDATTYEFITPALKDPETHGYIGAISFHSWRGCDNWTLSIWADAARELNIPLLVGEGSTDAAAHEYPDIFFQPAYSLNEIEMYLRIASICQVRSILQWQLTADYSILAGDGIYNTKGMLRPTQRFWNLKQFGLTPSGSFYLPLDCDRPNVSCVAFGDIAKGRYVVHIVNSGAGRQVTLSGLPDCVKQLRLVVTDPKRGMEEGKRVQVSSGTARFTLDPACFTTLISVP
jgi:hypothetical protein